MLANIKPKTSSFKKDIKFFLYIFFFEWKEITKNNIDIKIEYIKYFESLKISKFNKWYIEFFSKIEKKYIEINKINDFIKLMNK